MGICDSQNNQNQATTNTGSINPVSTSQTVGTASKVVEESVKMQMLQQLQLQKRQKLIPNQLVFLVIFLGIIILLKIKQIINQVEFLVIFLGQTILLKTRTQVAAF